MKYFVLDVDQWNTNTCLKIAKQVKERSLTEKNSIIALTKYNLASVPDHLINGNVFDYLITADGTEIRSLKEGSLLYSNYLSEDIAHVLREILHKSKTKPEVQVNGKIYVERKDYHPLKKSAAAKYRQDTGIEPVYGVLQLLQLFEDRIEKVKAFSQSESQLMELGRLLEKSLPEDKGQIIRGKNYIEIRPEGNSKTKALDIIQQKLDIRKQDIVQLTAF